jgi:hypothetical protein
MTRTCGQPGRLVARVALSGPIGCLAFDGLNETMLTQIVVNRELLHSPACASELENRQGRCHTRPATRQPLSTGPFAGDSVVLPGLIYLFLTIF